MKKNTMMRLAAILLVGVLLTTSVIGGTFAKYTTSGTTGTETARVAKFGVEIVTTNFDTLFNKEYAANAVYKDKADVTIGTTVSASDDDDLVAPGTSGSFADIKITGTPEVAVDVKIAAEVVVSNNWTVDSAFYCPIVVTVAGTPISGLDYTSAADFATAIKTAIDGKSDKYAPGTVLDATYGDGKTTLDVEWAWAFNGDGVKQTDEKDTALGELAADGTELTISIKIDITVEQLD